MGVSGRISGFSRGKRRYLSPEILVNLPVQAVTNSSGKELVPDHRAPFVMPDIAPPTQPPHRRPLRRIFKLWRGLVIM